MAKVDEEGRRQVIAQQLGGFPRELSRCTCSTASWDRDDHANTCPLGPTPPTSSTPARQPTARRPPEEMF